MLNRIRFVFYDNINVEENVFLFSEREQERDTLDNISVVWTPINKGK